MTICEKFKLMMASFAIIRAAIVEKGGTVTGGYADYAKNIRNLYSNDTYTYKIYKSTNGTSWSLFQSFSNVVGSASGKLFITPHGLVFSYKGGIYYYNGSSFIKFNAGINMYDIIPYQSGTSYFVTKSSNKIFVWGK